MGIYISPIRTTDCLETPDEFFNNLDTEFHFTLDVAASAENAKCPNYLTAEIDALDVPWTGICWMNPPYSQCGKWMKKAYNESRLHGTTVVCLVPSATDTKWWHKYAVKGEIRFIKGRLRFKGTTSSAPFPSAVVIFWGLLV